MEELRFSNGDALSAAVLAGLGGYIVVEARQWTYLGADGPGPAFFPIWYGIALIVLSLVVIGARVYRITAGGPHEAPLSRSQRREIGHALAVWLAFAVSIALLKSLGFLIAFGLLTLFIVAVIYRRPWKVALAVAVASALGFHVVFAIALGVGLPTGIFGF